MRIGYGKFCRSMSFTEDKWGFQGDAEAPNLLMRLARRNPDVEWVLVGRNDLGDRELLPNIFNPWKFKPRTGQNYGLIEKIGVLLGSLDGAVLHAGQHGTSHKSIPQSHSTWEQYYADPLSHATTPQDWSVAYGGFIVDGLNIMGDRTDGKAPVVWIVTDPRNFLKARDIKWPAAHSDILAQYQYSRAGRHERFRDSRPPQDFGYDFCTPDDTCNGEVWDATHTYRYGGLELMILPDNWQIWGERTFTERKSIGIASTSFNDGRIGKEPRRSELIRDWMLSEFPDAEVSGKWDPVSLTDLPPGVKYTEGDPATFPDTISRWRVTMSLPALGSSWTVAKPFQAWAANTVCFMVGRVDDQGWILPTRRQTSLTRLVGILGDVPFYSIRDDWTPEELQLAQWLRVETPEEFAQRARFVSENEDAYRRLAATQRELLAKRWDQSYVETEIERALGLLSDH
jgi:hypothetical protein